MMSSDGDATRIFDRQDLLEEMRGLDLGDARRENRMLRVMEAMAAHPSGSFASMTASEAEQEAMYRLLRNERVGWEQVLQPHVDSTTERAREARQVLAVHDTSLFRVADDANLGSYLNTGKQGFLAHVSLVISAHEFRRPLGVAAVEILQRPKEQRRTRTEDGRKMSGSSTSKLSDREFLRWWRGVERVEKQLQGVDITHVMDREGDSFELLSQLKQASCHYVIRMCKDRNARLDGEESAWSTIRSMLASAQETDIEREVPVSKRKGKSAPRARKASPVREARVAKLKMAHCSLELKKPRYLPKSDGWAASLTVNVVRVYEPAPPAEQDPIEWVLLTNLSTDDSALVERVVDIYRQRWLIEEFFRAHKTGCGYRTRRLLNTQTILNSFAACIPIAWKALTLRHLARDSDQPASAVLDPDELAVLRAKAVQLGKPLPDIPSAADALAFVAQLGGHRKSKGRPGWMVIARGLERVEKLAEGWALAREGLEM